MCTLMELEYNIFLCMTSPPSLPDSCHYKMESLVCLPTIFMVNMIFVGAALFITFLDFSRVEGFTSAKVNIQSIEKRVLSAEDQSFLDIHNEKRRIVNPQAANMKKLEWNEELARIARRYARRCTFRHNTRRSSQSNTFSYVGENLYVTSVTPNSPADALLLWDNEKVGYTYSNGFCDLTLEETKRGGGCGHYTQVVWANTEYVGCAKHHCDRGVRNFPKGRTTPGYLYVCNYGIGGNIIGQKPYIRGIPCSQCPQGYSCENRLCTRSGSSYPCANVNCGSNGQCVNGLCQCNSGWTGATCQTRQTIDPCENLVCGDANAECVNGICQCKSGWTGTNCLIPKTNDPCEKVSCGRNGQCVAGRCQCRSGWTGSNCQTRISAVVDTSCSFERTQKFPTGWCMTNYSRNQLNFDRYFNILRTTKRTIPPADGSYFVAIRSSSTTQQTGYIDYWWYLPETPSTVTFNYNIIGRGALNLFYYQNGRHNLVRVRVGDTTRWRLHRIYIPQGTRSWFYFQARVGNDKIRAGEEDVVAIDNVKVLRRW